MTKGKGAGGHGVGRRVGEAFTAHQVADFASASHSFTKKSPGWAPEMTDLMNISFCQPLSLHFKFRLQFNLLDLDKTACFRSLSSVVPPLIYAMILSLEQVGWWASSRWEGRGTDAVFPQPPF